MFIGDSAVIRESVLPRDSTLVADLDSSLIKDQAFIGECVLIREGKFVKDNVLIMFLEKVCLLEAVLLERQQ